MIRQIEPVTIEIFIDRCFHEKQVHAIITKWRVEPSEIQVIVVKEMKEMGIYFSKPFQEVILLKSVINFLKSSPDIRRLVKRAEFEELKRNQSRHAAL